MIIRGITNLVLMYGGIWIIALQSLPDSYNFPGQSNGLMFLAGLWAVCLGLSDIPMDEDDTK